MKSGFGVFLQSLRFSPIDIAEISRLRGRATNIFVCEWWLRKPRFFHRERQSKWPCDLLVSFESAKLCRRSRLLP